MPILQIACLPADQSENRSNYSPGSIEHLSKIHFRIDSFWDAYSTVTNALQLCFYKILTPKLRVDFGFLLCIHDVYGLVVCTPVGPQGAEVSLHINLTWFSEGKSQSQFLQKANPRTSMRCTVTNLNCVLSLLHCPDLTRSCASHVLMASSAKLMHSLCPTVHSVQVHDWTFF